MKRQIVSSKDVYLGEIISALCITQHAALSNSIINWYKLPILVLRSTCSCSTPTITYNVLSVVRFLYKRTQKKEAEKYSLSAVRNTMLF